MLAQVAQLLHLPPIVAYVIVLAALLLGAGLLGVVLHRIFHRVARHVKGFSGDVTIEFLEYLVLPLLVAGALDLAIAIINLPPHYESTVRRLMSAVVLVVVFNFLSRAVALFLRDMATKDASFLRLTQPAILAERVAFALLALMIFLENMGVSLTAVWTTLGVGSVAIGLALQATLSNLFAGITILADRPISPGDHITLLGNNVEGEVTRIGWRATEVRTVSNEVAFVPNSTVASSVLVNYSLTGAGATASIVVKVNAASDEEKVESALVDTAKKVAGKFPPPTRQEPQVILTSDYTDPFLQYSIKVPVARLSDRDAVATALRKEVARRYQNGELQKP